MAGSPGRCRASDGLDFVWKNAEKRDGRVACRQHVLEEGVMTFERGWVLLFLSLPVAWLLFEWRKTRRTTALVLKTLAFLAIVLALAEPRLTLPETKMAVAVLVDTSASVSSADLTHASQLVSTLEETHGRHWIRILPFARAVRNQAPEEQQRACRVEYTAGEA